MKLAKINKNQKTPITLAILLIIIGLTIISFPILDIINLKFTLYFAFGSIALFNLVSYIITHKDQDIESILTFSASVLIIILIALLGLKENVNIAVILLLWVAFISFIRLKKADYYDDRKNKAWIIQMVSLAIFIITGILTSINLNHSTEIKELLFGYFFLINGILELIDPLILHLGKLNENSK